MRDKLFKLTPWPNEERGMYDIYMRGYSDITGRGPVGTIKKEDEELVKIRIIELRLDIDETISLLNEVKHKFGNNVVLDMY